MGIFGNKKNLINIAEDDLQDAQLSVAEFNNEEVRKRAFINVLGARLAMKLLFSRKIEANNLYSMYSIHNVLRTLDIADIYFQNIKIDVRLVFNENEIFIPRSHFDFEILPQAYLILALKEDLSSAEMIGFFEPETLDKSNCNKDYYFIEKSQLRKADDFKSFLKKYPSPNRLEPNEESIESAKMMFLSHIDDELSTHDQQFMLTQIAESLALRSSLVEFENFEILASKTINNEELAQDGVLGIVATQDIHGVDEEELELETINFNEDVQEIGLKEEEIPNQEVQHFDDFEESEEVLEIENLDSMTKVEEFEAGEESFEFGAATGLKQDEQQDEKGEKEEAGGFKSFMNDAADIATDAALIGGGFAAGLAVANAASSTDAVKEGLSLASSTIDTLGDIAQSLTQSSEEAPKNILCDDDLVSSLEQSAIEEFLSTGDVDEDVVVEEITTEESDENSQEDISYELFDDSLDDAFNELSDESTTNEESDENYLEDLSLDLDSLTEENDEIELETVEDEIKIANEELFESMETSSNDTLESEINEADNDLADFTTQNLDELDFSTDDLESFDVEEIEEADLSASSDENIVEQNDNSEFSSLEAVDEFSNMEILSEIDTSAFDLNSLMDNDFNAEELSALIDESKKSDETFEELTLETQNEFKREETKDEYSLSDDESLLDTEIEPSYLIETSDEAISYANIEQENTESSIELSEDISDKLSELSDENEFILEELTPVSLEPLPIIEEEVEELSDSQISSLEEDTTKEDETENLVSLDNFDFSILEDENIEQTIQEVGIKTEELTQLNIEEDTLSFVEENELEKIEAVIETSKENTIPKESINEKTETSEGLLEEADDNEIEAHKSMEDLTSITSQVDELLGQLELSEDIQSKLSEELLLESVDTAAIEQSFIQEIKTEAEIDSVNEAAALLETIDEKATESKLSQQTEIGDPPEMTPESALIDEDKELLQSLFEKENITDESVLSFESITAESSNKPALNKKTIIAASVAGAMIVTVAIGTISMNAQKNVAGNDQAAPNSAVSTLSDQAPGTLDALSNDTENLNMPSDQIDKMPLSPEQAKMADAKSNRDMGQAVSDAFLSEPITASVSKIAWEVPEDLAYNDSFRKYLQTAGKNIKLTLQNDLLLATELAYSNKVLVDLSIDKSGNLKSSSVIVSSGSKQIDNIVLQSVKETLKYLKLPANELSSQSVDATLIINF